METGILAAIGLGVLYGGKQYFNGGVNKFRDESVKDKVVIITGST
jgi:hypothetical protein